MAVQFVKDHKGKIAAIASAVAAAIVYILAGDDVTKIIGDLAQVVFTAPVAQ